MRNKREQAITALLWEYINKAYPGSTRTSNDTPFGWMSAKPDSRYRESFYELAKLTIKLTVPL